jgi:hypothetical protein
VQLSRYNPPWTLPFWRRNEVWVKLDDWFKFVLFRTLLKEYLNQPVLFRRAIDF